MAINVIAMERNMRTAIDNTLRELGFDVAPVLCEVMEYLKKNEGVKQYIEDPSTDMNECFDIREDDEEGSLHRVHEAIGLLSSVGDLSSVDGGGDLEKYIHAVNLVANIVAAANPMAVMMDTQGFGASVARYTFGLVRLYPEIIGLQHKPLEDDEG